MALRRRAPGSSLNSMKSVKGKAVRGAQYKYCLYTMRDVICRRLRMDNKIIEEIGKRIDKIAIAYGTTPEEFRTNFQKYLEAAYTDTSPSLNMQSYIHAVNSVPTADEFLSAYRQIKLEEEAQKQWDT